MECLTFGFAVNNAVNIVRKSSKDAGGIHVWYDDKLVAKIDRNQKWVSEEHIATLVEIEELDFRRWFDQVKLPLTESPVVD